MKFELINLQIQMIRFNWWCNFKWHFVVYISM